MHYIISSLKLLNDLMNVAGRRMLFYFITFAACAVSV